MKTFTVTSTAFNEGEMIPSKYTCDAEELSPPMSLSGVPEEAKSLALIMDDPDTSIGTFVHWVTWNIDPKTLYIAEGVVPTGVLGKNGTGETGYVSPCPPTGTHHYHFKWYALDTELSLTEGTKVDLLKAMEGHVVGQGELVGLYKKNQ